MCLCIGILHSDKHYPAQNSQNSWGWGDTWEAKAGEFSLPGLHNV